MKEAEASGPTEALWQDMEHEQVEELFTGNGSCPVGLGFGVEVSKRYPALFAAENILFLDDAPVEVTPEIDKDLVAVADVFTVYHPLLGAVPWDLQAMVDQGLQELCPEDLCQCLLAEEIAPWFGPPESGLQVDGCRRHDDMDVGMVLQGPGMGVENGGSGQIVAGGAGTMDRRDAQTWRHHPREQVEFMCGGRE